MTTELPGVLAARAYEHAAGAVAGALEELGELGARSEVLQTILVKHLLAHFDGLEVEFRQVLERDLATTLADVAGRRRASGRDS